MPRLPAGIRNKNYLNVKNNPNDPWMDKNGPSGSDNRKHAVFSDPIYGIRAGIITLRSYFFVHNKKTVAEILARWAPSTDTIGSIPGAPSNSPLKYSIFVCNQMNVGPNDILEIFKNDKTIGNIDQLKKLVSAMAEYEIGSGFHLPIQEFRDGLELVQPGINEEGTLDPINDENSEESVEIVNELVEWKITASVGRKDKGAVNLKPDIETIQDLLRQITLITSNSLYDPGKLDGLISSNWRKSSTVKAIINFQKRFLLKPDGVIDVSGRSWREMLKIAYGDQRKRLFYFPFSKLPILNWTASPRKFGANRSNNRAHAACDLYYPVGTPVHAITDGTVIRGAYYFYDGTYAVEVDHGEFVARYGELKSNIRIREGQTVKAGEIIGYVGDLQSLNVSMLHLEMFDKSHRGNLTQPASNSLRAPNGRSYRRRKDLIDPTPFLNEWKNNLAPSDVSDDDCDHGVECNRRSNGATTLGFSIVITRTHEQSAEGRTRTIGNYKCYWEGGAIAGLEGQIAERQGPGDNTSSGINNRRRIEEGVYPVLIHHGTRYRTHRYVVSDTYSEGPKPALLIGNTGQRTAILIHPGRRFLSSIGCLNPTSNLTSRHSKINFKDSRDRTIAIMEEIKAKLGDRYPRSGRIPETFLVVRNEP